MNKPILILTFLLVGYLLIHLELYFPFNPYIDTVFTEQFSFDKFKQIKTGTNKSGVESLIGEGNINGPWSVLPDSDKEEVQCVQYSADRTSLFFDFAWIGVGVCYDKNNIVTRKYETVVHN